MFLNTHTRALATLALLIALPACSSGEPDDDGAGEEELVTQVMITMTPQGGGSPVTIMASDPDGDGAGVTFSPATLALAPNTTYTGSIMLADTINDEDITEEIEEEAEEHLFQYAFTPASLGTVTITDTESDYTTGNDNGGDFAVGLDFQVTTGASGSGTLSALLYHFDDAPKAGSTVAPGEAEVDIDVDFPVTIQGLAVTRR